VSVDWTSARRVSYLVEQSFRYEYPAPIRDLRHRLVVIPPERFGDQRRIDHRVEVGASECLVENRSDDFGNLIIDIQRCASSAAPVSRTGWPTAGWAPITCSSRRC
jgi:Bacterial transglutaminase-like N-terminal region